MTYSLFFYDIELIIQASGRKNLRENEEFPARQLAPSQIWTIVNQNFTLDGS